MRNHFLDMIFFLKKIYVVIFESIFARFLCSCKIIVLLFIIIFLYIKNNILFNFQLIKIILLIFISNKILILEKKISLNIIQYFI